MLLAALLLLCAAGARAQNTYTVTTTTDSSDGSCSTTCSLRDAITAANADSADVSSETADTIEFSSPVTGVITLGGALPAITAKYLAIQGPGANLLTVSGNNSSTVGSIFAIGAVNTVNISGLTIANGYNTSTCGGGISNSSGALIVTNSTFSGNYSTFGGGGLCSSGSPNAAVSVTNSTFSGNSAFQGGAISNVGTSLIVINSTFSGNGSTLGGAIYNNNTGIGDSAVVINSTFSDNAASIEGGGIYNDTSLLTITNTLFSGNSAIAGGGIYVTGGTLAMTDSLMTGDTGGECGGSAACPVNGTAGNVVGSSAGLLQLGWYGGPTETMLPQPGSSAICAGTATLPTPTILPAHDQRGFPMNNSCVDIGAVQTNYLTVTTNADSNDGSCTGSLCSLRDAITAANAAPLSTSVDPAGSDGADIDFSSTAFPAAPATTTIAVGSMLPAITGVANIIGPGASVATVSGGGPTSSYSLFAVNSGAQAAFYGLTFTNAGNTAGGGIASTGTLTVLNSIFSGNTVTVYGGGIYSDGILTVANSTFSGNSVTGASPLGGGAISSQGALTVTNSTFDGNTSLNEANGYGGAISIIGGTLTVTNSTFSGNSAGSSGGAIAFSSQTGTITNSTFSGNTSLTGNGGGIYLSTGTLTVTNSIFNGNSAPGGQGPGIYSAGTITDSYNDFNNSGTHGFTKSGTDLSSNPLLATLANYGGFTQTMPPQPGSPALSAGSYRTGEPATDQRGAPRPSTADAAIDMGSVQVTGNPPVIGAVTPNNGPVDGGTSVVITGTGLDAATAVYFGGASVSTSNFTITAAVNKTPAFITALSPAGTGTVDVTVTNGNGTGATNSNDQFTYYTPLAIAPPAGDLSASYGSSYDQDFTVSNGSGSYTLTNTGSLPTGLALSPSTSATGTSWTLSGTPTSTGNYKFFLTATDNTYPSNTVTQKYSLTVLATPAISVNQPTLAYGQGGTIVITLSPPSESGLATPGGTINYSIDGGTTQEATIVDGVADIPLPATLSAGNHNVVYRYSGDSNYSDVAKQTLTQSIGTAVLTVTVNDSTRVYGADNSTAIPAFSGTVVSGLVNEDTATSVGLTYSTPATAASLVGNYNIKASITSNNYTLSANNGKLTITPATLTVTVNDSTRVYGADNSTAIPAFSGTVVSGLVNEDTATSVGLTYSTPATAASPVGNYNIKASITSNNYTLSANNGKLTITPATLTVTVNDSTRAYGADNSTATPPFSGTVVSGLVNEDTATSVGLTYSTPATAASPVGKYNIKASITSNNYTLSANNGKLTITPAVLTVTVNDSTRAYGADNSTAIPAFSGTVVSGLVNEDTATSVGLTYSTPATAASPVGNYNIKASITSNNYTLSANNGKLTITPATLTVTVNDSTRAYGADNSTATPPFSGTVVSGLVNEDTATSVGLTYSTHATAASPVGRYRIHASITSPNYTLSANRGRLTITAAVLTVTVNNSSRAYGADNSTATPPLGGTIISGLANEDTATSIGLTYSSTATAASPVGPYPITASITSTNYTLSANTGTLTVTADVLRVEVNNSSRAYGALNSTATPPLSGTILSALANGDTADSIGLTYSSPATTTSPLGRYPIYASITSPNYTLSANTGRLTVVSAVLTVAVNNSSRIYGTLNSAATPPLSGAIESGLVNGDTAATVGLTYWTTAIPGATVGTYPVYASITDAKYALSANTGTLTVTQAPTTTTLSTGTNSITPGQNVGLSALVQSSTIGIPSGSVSFYNGDTLLGTASLKNGVASFAASGFTPGETNELTAVYSGNTDFLTSNSGTAVGIGVAALNFTLIPQGNQSQTIMPGGTATYNFRITPTYGVYPATVNFSIAGLPPDATVVFSPSSVASDGGAQNVIVTVQTAGATASTTTQGNPLLRKGAPLALGFLLLPFLGMRRIRRSRMGRGLRLLFLIAASAAGLASLSGCVGPKYMNGPTAQSYSITITAASGSAQQNLGVTLNLQ